MAEEEKNGAAQSGQADAAAIEMACVVGAPPAEKDRVVARHPHPEGRIVVVDFGKGLSMFGMVVLHYAGSGIEDLGGAVSAGPGIINGVFQLMNGMFFFLSAFGNYVSLRRQLDRGASFAAVRKVILLRGFVLFWVSIFLGSALSSCGGGGPDCEDWLRWAVFQSVHDRPGSIDKFGTDRFKVQLFTPFVIPFIAFNVMVTSLIALWAEQAARKRLRAQLQLKLNNSDTTERRQQLVWKIKVLAAAACTMLVLGVLLRIILDRATCTGGPADGSDGSSCLGYECETPSYNASEVLSVPSRFPDQCYVTHAANADFSDNKEWQPCAGVGGNSTTIYPNFTGFRVASNDPLKRCARFRNLHVSEMSGFSLAMMPQTERGYRWCPTNVSRDGIMPSAEDLRNPKLERCLLVPWWGPASGTDKMATVALWDRLTPGQRFYGFVNWPFLGRYGLFGYGAATCAGAATAMWVMDPHVGGWNPELFEGLYKVSFFAMLVGIGPALGLFAIDAGSHETAQMASTWMRLLFGGIELVTFTFFAHVIEGRPEAGCHGCRGYCCCRCCNRCRCCPFGAWGSPQFARNWFYRLCRRFGAISLTVYILQNWIFDLVSLLFNGIAGFRAPWCMYGMYPPGSDCGVRRAAGEFVVTSGTVVFMIIANMLLFCGVVWLWQQCNFVGSFEWMIQKILGCARKSKSSALVMKKVGRPGGRGTGREDCTCRGLYSENCGVVSFCCGSCRGDRTHRNGGDEREDYASDELEYAALLNMNACTGSTGKWGVAAGTICGVAVLAIVVGAQL